MHLNLLDTSPLKVFASSLRSKLRVCWVDQLLAELTLTDAQDRRLLLASASNRVCRVDPTLAPIANSR